MNDFQNIVNPALCFTTSNRENANYCIGWSHNVLTLNWFSYRYSQLIKTLKYQSSSYCHAFLNVTHLPKQYNILWSMLYPWEAEDAWYHFCFLFRLGNNGLCGGPWSGEHRNIQTHELVCTAHDEKDPWFLSENPFRGLLYNTLLCCHSRPAVWRLLQVGMIWLRQQT